ncbi:MerR family transcriptional regulator [Limimaricola hongkongensis]|uniref:Phage DNA packaging Nu1 n=1 Tax=Limimaricola hongkongensis DSM 17492 TaxID=1122180 RepID=A0A017HCB4_9RHOB|nr:terminase small subunit [Limimaricola hongkongensis]EYD71798.1 phage DNA packaging Nu1 [Limimaricola hongkongensis DSM 17492]
MPSAVDHPLVSQTLIAGICGVTTDTIRAWERKGCPVERKGRKGVAAKYRPADVIRWREEQAALAASGNLAAMDMKEAQRRKVAAEAATAELNLAKAKGEVVAIDLVGREVGAALAACRARLMSIGASVAPKVDLAPDTAAVKEMIDDAIYEALDEISGVTFEFGADPEEGDPQDAAGPSDGDDDAAAEADAQRMG